MLIRCDIFGATTTTATTRTKYSKWRLKIEINHSRKWVCHIISQTPWFLISHNTHTTQHTQSMASWIVPATITDADWCTISILNVFCSAYNMLKEMCQFGGNGKVLRLNSIKYLYTKLLRKMLRFRFVSRKYGNSKIRRCLQQINYLFFFYRHWHILVNVSTFSVRFFFERSVLLRSLRELIMNNAVAVTLYHDWNVYFAVSDEMKMKIVISEIVRRN